MSLGGRHWYAEELFPVSEPIFCFVVTLTFLELASLGFSFLLASTGCGTPSIPALHGDFFVCLFLFVTNFMKPIYEGRRSWLQRRDGGASRKLMLSGHAGCRDEVWHAAERHKFPGSAGSCWLRSARVFSSSSGKGCAGARWRGFS